MDEDGFVLDILLQRHRDTEAAKIFLTRLLRASDVPEVIQTDQLLSYGAAIRERPSLTFSKRSLRLGARTPMYTTTRATTARIEMSETRSRMPEFTHPDHPSLPSFPHVRHCRHPKNQPEHSVADVAYRDSI
ncbi:hypothetical protein GCM10008957_51820 [Deinococcus ruber]|uniref:DDE domain-containing protein n=1 Tax=Deinococcus ruber TaxID=1848197 RepID=A0A918FFY8_9DEIO|nr:hypothetical protein GCM10008957_51820 [Deinococcus ruber]